MGAVSAAAQYAPATLADLAGTPNYSGETPGGSATYGDRLSLPGKGGTGRARAPRNRAPPLGLGATVPVVGLEFFIFLFVLGTTIWVGVDNRAMDRDYGHSGGPSTAPWVIGCILVWIVFFPWYLFHRHDRRQTAEYIADLEEEETNALRTGIPPTGAFCGACGTQQALPEDRFCRGCGAPLAAG